jgi:hypothetical protein
VATALSGMQGHAAQLALLVSCECRKIVMKQEVLQELKLARQSLGPDAAIAGFFSYGELAPLGESTPCALHNQTLTFTTLAES